MSVRERLSQLHVELDACRACPKMTGPAVHPLPVETRILLIGQAPGPREGGLGRPFAWTAGRTLFQWFSQALGADEASIRTHVYLSAVARCFPGKAKGGGDRKPDPTEISACQRFLRAEVGLLRPRLLLPVGALAIEQVLGHRGPLVDVIGQQRRILFHGVRSDVIPLPHPSGASSWHRTEPGKTLLVKALSLLAAHPEVVRTFSRKRRAATGQ